MAKGSTLVIIVALAKFIASREERLAIRRILRGVVRLQWLTVQSAVRPGMVLSRSDGKNSSPDSFGQKKQPGSWSGPNYEM